MRREGTGLWRRGRRFVVQDSALWRDDENPGVLDVYFPLDEPDLYKRFAELGRHASFEAERTPQAGETAIVDFVEAWGLPWEADWRDNSNPGQLPSVADIRREAADLNIAIELCAAWPALPAGVERRFPSPSLDPLSAGNPFIWLERKFREHLADVAEYPVLSLGNHRRGLRRDYWFRSLLGAMWLQLADSIKPGLIPQRCRFRGCPLVIGDPRPGQLYCNNTCKRAENQAVYRENLKARRKA
jgi:hypothetical protein